MVLERITGGCQYIIMVKNSAEHCHFCISLQDEIVFHHFVEEEKRLHGMREAVFLSYSMLSEVFIYDTAVFS